MFGRAILFPRPVQPLHHPFRLNVSEAFSIHARCAIIGFRQRPRPFAEHPRGIPCREADRKRKSGSFLRLAIQFDLKFPNFIRRFQTQSSITRAFPPSQTHLKQGPFPPPALPGFSGTSDLSDSKWSAALSGDVRVSQLRDHSEPPPLTLITFLACCAHYPGGPYRCTMVIV